MTRLGRLIDRLTSRLENAAALDAVADKVATLVGRITPPGPVKDLASGTPTAHPLHPPLTAVTIGAFSAATILDLTRGDPAAARRLVGVGLLAVVPTAYAGLSDWSDTAGAERRIGLVHAAVNDLAVTCFLGSWIDRRRGRSRRAVGLSLAGWILLSLGGYWGGHLAYAMGVGVDTTAFQHLDSDWTDVAAEADVPTTSAISAQVAGVSVLLARDGSTIVAMVDRCTHRGGPLHEGTVVDGCVQCPWHGSRFRLDDGSVSRGPATRPQPMLDVRVEAGRVLVSRHEQRTLRSRPVS